MPSYRRRINQLAFIHIAALVILLLSGSLQGYASEPMPQANANKQQAEPGSVLPESDKDKPEKEKKQKTLFKWNIVLEKRDDDEKGDGTEEDRIVTDRPHFSEASSLVGLGRVQVETGYTYSFDGRPVSAVFPGISGTERVRTHSFPETLLRAGLFAEWFEFRIAGNFLVEQTRNPDLSTTRVSGADDTYLGAKLALTENEGWLPEMALFPQIVLPTGASAFTSGQALPGFNFAYSWKLNKVIELECNTQVNRRRDDDQHFYTEFIQTANVEYELTKNVGAFTEWFCFIPNGSLSALPQHYFHGGFVWCPNDNIQFDIHAAAGLNEAADDFFAGTGFSFRF